MSRHHDPAEHLICHAQGITTASAAIELLCAHRAWPGKPPFTSRCVITGARASGEPCACIDWSDAITALNAGLDDRNIQVLITAVLHASRQRPAHRRP